MYGSESGIVNGGRLVKYIPLRVIIFMMKGTSVITRFSRRDGGVDFYNENSAVLADVTR